MQQSDTTEEQAPKLEHIRIWKCKQTDCKAWTREEFVTEATPSCPLCQGPMIRSYKHVPVTNKKTNKKFIMGKNRG